MKKPHKWAEVIKAWADGAKVQYRESGDTDWDTITNPAFDDKFGEYRIKPEPKPDYVRYVNLGWWYNADNGDYVRGATGVYERINTSSFNLESAEFTTNANIKVTYDGETNEPKAVELIKA